MDFRERAQSMPPGSATGYQSFEKRRYTEVSITDFVYILICCTFSSSVNNYGWVMWCSEDLVNCAVVILSESCEI